MIKENQIITENNRSLKVSDCAAVSPRIVSNGNITTEHVQSVSQGLQEQNIHEVTPSRYEILNRPIRSYKETFIERCKKEVPRLSTGIRTLDINLSGGFIDELYILNAETSTGKSAFMLFVAQNLAEAGNDVLYFSLEMGKDELVARGVAMISFDYHQKNTDLHKVTTADILYTPYDHSIDAFVHVPYEHYGPFVDEYFTLYGKNLHIITPDQDGLTVHDILKIVSMQRANNPDRPLIIFIDYLQLLKADSSDRLQSDRKGKTDAAVYALKQLAMQFHVPVFAASSVSRAGYGKRIDTSSSKESGDTEFTTGVLLGWNWAGVTTEPDPKKRNEESLTCKKRGFRRMILDILKFRNAERDTSVHLKYYPAYNFFEVDYDWNKNIKSDASKSIIRV